MGGDRLVFPGGSEIILSSAIGELPKACTPELPAATPASVI
jgi:hypothetical protein